MTINDLIEAAERIRAETVAADPLLAGLPLAAIGWATIEAERAIRELDEGLAPAAGGRPRPSWAEDERDATLGARVWRHQAPDRSARPVVLVLEPDTEGRLAASLARFGEGVAVIYLGVGSVLEGRLVRGGKPWGPHVVLL